MIGILVAADDVDGIARDPQPRADDETAVDGIANRRVGGAGTLGAHVALGGKARHEVIARRAHREQGALRHRFLHGLQILGARMQEQVHVHIDEARHQGGAAQIDDFGARTALDRGTHSDDPLALDTHLARGLQTPVSTSRRCAACRMMAWAAPVASPAVDCGRQTPAWRARFSSSAPRTRDCGFTTATLARALDGGARRRAVRRTRAEMPG